MLSFAKSRRYSVSSVQGRLGGAAKAGPRSANGVGSAGVMGAASGGGGEKEGEHQDGGKMRQSET